MGNMWTLCVYRKYNNSFPHPRKSFFPIFQKNPIFGKKTKSKKCMGKHLAEIAGVCLHCPCILSFYTCTHDMCTWHFNEIIEGCLLCFRISQVKKCMENVFFRKLQLLLAKQFWIGLDICICWVDTSDNLKW